MAQTITIDLTPDGRRIFQRPFLHFSQGDVGQEFVINLKSRFGLEIPAGATVKIEATKPSGFGFSETGVLSDGTATFTTEAIMTDEAGHFPVELSITASGKVLGTANFNFMVEPDPHPEGTTDGQAEEVIPELTQLVERVEEAASSVLDRQTVTNTLPAGSQASYSFDEETNTQTFGIPQGEAGAGSAGVVANAYSASSTYVVGDYVIHNSNLYRCTTAITTAEAFTAAHWTQVVLGDDVSDVKSDLSKIESDALVYVDTTNKCDPDALSVGKAISDTYGTEYAQAAVTATDYIPVKQGDVVYFCAVKSDGTYLYVSGSNSFYEYTVKDPSGYVAHSNYTNGYTISNANTKYVRTTFSNNGAFNNARILCVTLNSKPTTASDVPAYFLPYYKNPYTDIDTIYGEIGNLKDKYASAIQNRVAYGFDTTTRLPNWQSNSNYEELTFEVPPFGTLEFPLSTGNAFICFAEYADGKVRNVFQTKGSAITIPEIGFERTAIKCTIDCKAFRRWCTYLSLTYEAKQDWYIYSRRSYVPDWLGVDEINNSFANGAGFILPAKAVVCGGVEMNIYYQNIVRYINTDKCHMVKPTDSYFEAYEGFARAKPNANVSATKNLGFKLYNHDSENPSLTSDEIEVKIIPKTSGNGLTKKVMLIGDSLTDANVYPQELVSMFSDDVMSIELLGTRHTDTSPNEGYAGWRAYTFDKCATNTDDWDTWGGTPPTQITNPFYNSVTQKFDLSKYMTDNNYSSVDYVFICLGANDLSRGNYDSDADLLEYYTDIITSIHSYDSDIRIGIWLPPTRALYVNCVKSSVDTALKINKFFIDNFGGQESSRIYLVPVYFNVDPKHDYPYQTRNVSDRNTSFQMDYCTDKLHLANAGYYKLADVIYSYIKYFGSLDS